MEGGESDRVRQAGGRRSGRTSNRGKECERMETGTGSETFLRVGDSFRRRRRFPCLLLLTRCNRLLTSRDADESVERIGGRVDRLHDRNLWTRVQGNETHEVPLLL